MLILPLAAGAALHARQQSALGAIQGQVAQPPESEGPEGFLVPHCVLYASEEGYRAAFAMNPWVDPQIIESFFADPSVTATWENGTLYQMCYSGRHELGG
jgi:hypothetical protein